LWVLKYLTLMQDHMALYQEINFSEYIQSLQSYNMPVSVEHLLWYVS